MTTIDCHGHAEFDSEKGIRSGARQAARQRYHIKSPSELARATDTRTETEADITLAMTAEPGGSVASSRIAAATAGGGRASDNSTWGLKQQCSLSLSLANVTPDNPDRFLRAPHDLRSSVRKRNRLRLLVTKSTGSPNLQPLDFFAQPRGTQDKCGK